MASTPTTRWEGNLFINGLATPLSIALPAGCVADANIAAGAPGIYVQSTKLEHRNWHDIELFGETTAVTALTKWIHAVQGATGELVSLKAAIAVQATGSDRTVTVDLQKSTGGGAFTSVLTSTIGFTNASVIRTELAAVINTESLVAGDILKLVVTVAGVAGAQAEGLMVSLVWDEDPQ